MPADLTDTLRDLELELLDAATRKSRTALESLLTEDFVEFGSSGRVFDRATIISDLAAESPISTAAISSFRIVAEARDLAVVTYRVSISRTDATLPRQSLRSSIWVRREGRWQMRFHQGTREPDVTA